MSGPVRTLPYMAEDRFEMRVPPGLLGRLDEARGHESRASFVRRALERALAVETVGSGTHPVGAVRPAPVRASGVPPAAFDARDAAMERQRKLNEKRGS
jgi:hypothetical protein